VLRAALAEAGIDWTNDLTINELGSPAEVLEAVKNGAADAGVVWSPYRKMAEDQGLKIVKYSDDFPKFDNHPCCRQIATGANLIANAAAYTALQRAMIKAYDYYQADHAGTLEILAKYVATTPEILDAETYGEHGYSTPDPNINGVAEFWDAMKDANYITSEDVDIRDHVNTDIYETALNELLAEDPDNANYKKLQTAFSS
jgi:NitT/TauT family transport system substrate-binding protein